MAKHRKTDTPKSTSGGISRRKFVALTGAGAVAAASTAFERFRIPLIRALRAPRSCSPSTLKGYRT